MVITSQQKVSKMNGWMTVRRRLGKERETNYGLHLAFSSFLFPALGSLFPFFWAQPSLNTDQ